MDTKLFAAAAWAPLLLSIGSVGAGEPPRQARLRSIESKGVFLGECSLPGETPGDDVVPGQAVGAQLGHICQTGQAP